MTGGRYKGRRRGRVVLECAELVVKYMSVGIYSWSFVSSFASFKCCLSSVPYVTPSNSVVVGGLRGCCELRCGVRYMYVTEDQALVVAGLFVSLCVLAVW